MEVQVSFLTRRRSGSISSRSHEVPCEVLHIGRAPENQVHLQDPRIALYQASLKEDDTGFFFEATGDIEVKIDGQKASSGTVAVGTVIHLGPFEIKVVKPSDKIDLALTVELIAPLGDTLDKLKARSTTSFEGLWISRRRLSWAIAVPILVLFFVWPLVGVFMDQGNVVERASPLDLARSSDRIWPIAGDLAWDTGELSMPHRFLAKQCNACHQKPFERVADQACAACHAKIQHHVDPAKHRFPELTEVLCQSCHKEHLGPSHIVRNDQDFCANCHGRLQESFAGISLIDTRDFGVGHPQFRPAVPVDPASGKRERKMLDEANWPTEASSLKFSHKQHLDPAGMRMLDRPERKTLGCVDCHVGQPDGRGMIPVTMEGACASCHRLNFDAARPERVVRHGDPEIVLREIREFYATIGLAGGNQTENAPASVRRRPGAPLDEAQRQEVNAWVGSQTALATAFLFEKAVCTTCHTVDRQTVGGRSSWTVRPTAIPERWLTKAKFNHRRHEGVDCVSCHRAPASQTTSDILLPRIEDCRQCHAGERTSAKVPSTCILCHDFHQPGLPPIHPEFIKSPSGGQGVTSAGVLTKVD